MNEFAMLAHHWNGSLEQVRGWMCSRKFNGWSAVWDGGITRGMLATDVPWYYKGGDRRQILSTGLWSLGRANKPKVQQAPLYFLDKLPRNIPVHGELWYNDDLTLIKKVCGRKLGGYHAMWHHIKFIAFGIKHYSLWSTENEIISALKDSNLDKGIKHKDTMHYLHHLQNDTFEIPIYLPVRDERQLKVAQKTALINNWEGLMFSNPDGVYECKRSYNNLKWTPEYETEAAIDGYKEGKKGKTLGKVGSIRATLVWDEKVASIHGGKEHFIGKEAIFHISGLEMPEREWDVCKKKYPIGTKIHFSFKYVSSHGIPQSCNIYRKDE